MTKLEITCIQKGIVLDGIARPLNGSFFYSCSVAMKRKKPEERSKG